MHKFLYGDKHCGIHKAGGQKALSMGSLENLFGGDEEVKQAFVCPSGGRTI